MAMPSPVEVAAGDGRWSHVGGCVIAGARRRTAPPVAVTGCSLQLFATTTTQRRDGGSGCCSRWGSGGRRDREDATTQGRKLQRREVPYLCIVAARAHDSEAAVVVGGGATGRPLSSSAAVRPQVRDGARLSFSCCVCLLGLMGFSAKDIWCYIHSLMPMRDAARVACVSRAFLSSWRCHPNLTFNKYALGLDEDGCETDFIRKVDHILKKHSGNGVKTFKLQVPEQLDVCGDNVDRWLQFAVTSGIEELALMLHGTTQKNYFPSSLLSDGIANSIRFLHLGHCGFHPTVELGSWRNLIRLCLSFVHITGDDLVCLLSNSLSLEWLDLWYCGKIVVLKIPCTLQRLSYLKVWGCKRMRVIESKAPKLSSFNFYGYKVKLSLGEWLQVKELHMLSSHLVRDAFADLPYMMPNLETLSIYSRCEIVNTQVLTTTKLLYLKYLSISLSALTDSPAYDYFPLVSFLGASPFLETFFLSIAQQQMKQKSILGDSSPMRKMPEHRHDHLKSVTITGFCSAKSLVELISHILENTISLECLTLNTTHGLASRFEHSPGTCFPMHKSILVEVPKALSAIKTYIEGKVPSSVRFNVLEPCSMCNDIW
uniref:At1g61320/AtMIF1 LRR domain-containing protein n=1 Tax=Leersia perrieri TaxID=77586 RepID=A0A0D9XFC2_9ORYZ